MRVDDLIPNHSFREGSVNGGVGRRVGGCDPDKELLGVPIEERREICNW